MRFDHIGVFVRDIETGKQHLQRMLPIRAWSVTYDDPGLNVRVCFGADSSGVRYELVAPFGEPNPVAGVLKSGKNVLNHVAYRVDDIEQTQEALRRQGAVPLGEPRPAMAFGGANVLFLLTPLTFIIELIQNT